MSKYCDNVQGSLAEKGCAWLHDQPQAQNHVIDCTSCFECLEALKIIDFELAQIATHDAPDSVVADLLAKIAALPQTQTTATVQKTRPSLSDYLRKRQLTSTSGKLLKIVFALSILGFLVLLLNREFVGKLFQILEGAFGALVMLVALGAVVFTLCKPGKQFRRRLMPAASFASIAVAVFALRSMVSLFFGSSYVDYESDMGAYQSARPPAYNAQPEEAGAYMEPQAVESDRSANDILPQAAAPGLAYSPPPPRGHAAAGVGADGSEYRQKNPPQKSSANYDIQQSLGESSNAPSSIKGMVAADKKDRRDLPVELAKAKKRNEQVAGVFKSLNDKFEALEGEKVGALTNAARTGGKINDDRWKTAHMGSASQGAVAMDERISKAKPDVAAKALEHMGDYSPKALVVNQPRGKDQTTASGTSVAKLEPVVSEQQVANEKRSRRQLPQASQLKPAPVVAKERLEAAQEVASDGDANIPRDDDSPLEEESSVEEVPAQNANDAIALAREYLKNRENLEDISPIEASGYWANTYLPGDVTMRLLHSAFLGADLSLLKAYLPGGALLHEGATQTTQPFDAPENSGLAVFLHTDQSGIQQQGRMIVQVGLKGSARRSGNRQAMNVAVVLDLRNNPSGATKQQLKELLFAFNQAKDLGDRFSLLVAGYPTTTALKPEDFKHGPLTVLVDSILGAEPAPTAGRSLLEAVQEAVTLVTDSDDPTTPLGSSAVVLLTGQDIGSEFEDLRELAHESSVAGVPLSVIGLDGSKQSELDELALSGQGNRRMLAPGMDPAQLVNKELTAVSDIVARAVRLRIRLAPGVQLIQVLGSNRLDEQRAEEVRQAEQSVDRRIAKNLGIEADRGEDEEGIQIVIPSFHANDAHVVLLDVIAPGPGPIADVTVRYKDLVHLKNGVARANLSLGRAQTPPSTLELNVFKNVLAFELAQVLSNAGTELALGNVAVAREAMQTHADLLRGLQTIVPGFERDTELERDRNMLEQYSILLGSSVLQDVTQRDLLRKSMEYAGKRKQQANPREE